MKCNKKCDAMFVSNVMAACSLSAKCDVHPIDTDILIKLEPGQWLLRETPKVLYKQRDSH